MPFNKIQNTFDGEETKYIEIVSILTLDFLMPN